jgi:hypothetical protein
MKTFKFLRENNIEAIRFVQPRYPRIVTRELELFYPEEYVVEDLRSIFRSGWRACERGREIYSNPFSAESRLIYAQYDAWERGWLECYHNHPSRMRLPTDEECYQTGQEQAQRGYPINTNPWREGTTQHSMFNRGWDDFVNNH